MAKTPPHRRVARLLAARGCSIVLAESCTGGLIAATLTRVPGISSHLCGSMVVYQNETKAAWLGIAPRILKSPGPVSETVAKLMAERVLERTPHADLSASVTGHLGPNAPPELDGLVFIGIARRQGKRMLTHVHRLECPPEMKRNSRQKLAAATVLRLVGELLESDDAASK